MTFDTVDYSHDYNIISCVYICSSPFVIQVDHSKLYSTGTNMQKQLKAIIKGVEFHR